jgi:four helix bundle protein
MVQHYKQLIAWQRAVDLVVDAYGVSEKFPRHEIYGLTSQLRRAAVSVPSNIAEGSGRRSGGEFLQFLGHSYGSLCELETHIIVADRLCYIDSALGNSFLERSEEVGRITNGLIASLEKLH